MHMRLSARREHSEEILRKNFQRCRCSCSRNGGGTCDWAAASVLEGCSALLRAVAFGAVAGESRGNVQHAMFGGGGNVVNAGKSLRDRDRDELVRR